MRQNYCRKQEATTTNLRQSEGHSTRLLKEAGGWFNDTTGSMRLLQQHYRKPEAATATLQEAGGYSNNPTGSLKLLQQHYRKHEATSTTLQEA
jgi:hypothetical protein